jgi:hypothetical protein
VQKDLKMEVRLNEEQKEHEGSGEQPGYLSSLISAKIVLTTLSQNRHPGEKSVHHQIDQQQFFSCTNPLLMVCREPGLSGDR